jgi:quinol monooxygenase YgiN
MIVLIGKALIHPDKRGEFLAAISASAVTSKQEPGNISYGWFESADTENQFMVVEEWESEAAMAAHLTSDDAKAFLRALSSVITEPPQLYRYDTPGRQLLPQ